MNESTAAGVTGTSAISESSARIESSVRVVLDALLEQGLLWARHGLHAGSAALGTSSRATSALAESLAKLADSLEPPAPGTTA